MTAQFPPLYRVDQHFSDTFITDVSAAVRAEFARFKPGGRIKPGQSVAVGVPSRGGARPPGDRGHHRGLSAGAGPATLHNSGHGLPRRGHGTGADQRPGRDGHQPGDHGSAGAGHHGGGEPGKHSFRRGGVHGQGRLAGGPRGGHKPGQAPHLFPCGGGVGSLQDPGGGPGPPGRGQQHS